MSELIYEGLSHTTRKTYTSAMKSVTKAMDQHRIQWSLPLQEPTLCMLVAALAYKISYPTLKLYLMAVRSWHVDNGWQLDMSGMEHLHRVVRGFRRSVTDSNRTERLPITTGVLNAIVGAINLRSWDETIFVAVSTVGTYGLFRLGELLGEWASGEGAMTWGQVTCISENSFSILLPTSKTDPFRKGTTITLFANNSPSCPYRAFIYRVYRTLTSPPNPAHPVFVLANGKRATRAWLAGRLRSVISSLGLDPSKYTGHSYRKGGATSLLMAGVEDSVIKQLGRWQSVAYQRYTTASGAQVRDAQQAMAGVKGWFGGNPAKLRPWIG